MTMYIENAYYDSELNLHNREVEYEVAMFSKNASFENCNLSAKYMVFREDADYNFDSETAISSRVCVVGEEDYKAIENSLKSDGLSGVETYLDSHEILVADYQAEPFAAHEGKLFAAHEDELFVAHADGF